MSKDAQALDDADMEQVSGGDGGGASFYWGDYVCPRCHGHVERYTVELHSMGTVTKYRCNACNRSFYKNELVEE